ncbi:MAG: hypothetical protein Q4Q06_05260 [Bacteroidota bacterium]|nr:hypothetical protein [Bacteroidota bacterium]
MDKFRNIADYILRGIFGLVFIFSGFVKAIDPMGTAYKVEEYLNVFGFSFLLNDALTFPIIIAIILCVLEFSLGVMMFFHIYNKPVRWAGVVFMTFFTITTFIDALTNNVSDCGCFGDAVKLTNWQTFWKNIVLDIILVGIFVFDKKEKEFYGKKLPFFATLLTLLVIVAFSVRNILLEPIVDFRPWKVGNVICPTVDKQQPPIAYATYKNNKTGKEKEFSLASEGDGTLMQAYEQDANFAENWTYVGGKERIINTNTIAADGFSLVELDDTKDNALEILGDTARDVYIVAVWNLKTTNEKGMRKIANYIKQLDTEKNNIIIVTASSTKTWYDFSQKYGLQDYMFYSCDDKAIKAMIRSNPGLVHLSKGVVKEKFAWRDL